jgi:2-methylcitrate dehydratase PrpD
MTLTYTEELARFATGLTIDDIPEDVRQVARLHLLDALGVALAATTTDFGSAIHDAGQQLGHGRDATVIGFGTRLPAASAALVNGALIHGLDFDDTHIGAIHHATAPALAAMLAVAEAEQSSGEEALVAYIIGLELGCRLAGAVPGELHDRGFHPTGIMGTFAAVAVAGRLRGLAPAALVRAFGLAGSQAAGVLEIKESWLKRLHPGWAAHSGIAATTMGAAGFVGPRTILEGEHGLYQSHVGRVPSRAELGLDSLGSVWMAADIALKPYPCCHFTHAFVDAALDLRAELAARGIALDQVERIEAPTSERLFHTVVEPREAKIAPRTTYDALFSVQYTSALALATGRADLAAFYDEPFDDPTVLATAAKVTCPIDTESDFPKRFPGELILHIADGSVLRRRVWASKGTPDNPLSTEEVLAKFRSTAGRALSSAGAEAVIEKVLTIDELATVTELVPVAQP